MEEWRIVEEFPEYEVSNQGRIRNKNKKILSPLNHTNGYLAICFGRKNRRLIHRVVGKAFLQEEQDKIEIDHINRDKKDNRATNLRWVTRSENNSNKGLGYSYCDRDNLWYVQKTIDRVRYRRSFKNYEDAIEYLNQLLS